MRVAGTVKRIVDPLLPSGPAARTIPFGPARGLRMEIDFAHQSRLYLGIFELELRRSFRAYCPPGAACFDVGAREGYVTLVLARLSAGGRVLAVDSDPEALEALRRNIALNPSLPREPEVRLARVTGGGDGDTTLDELAYGPGGFVPDVVKLDVEGWEREALGGGTRLLSERRPHLVVETHSERLERGCIEAIVSHGYAPRVVEPRRFAPEVREGHNRWLVAEGAPFRPGKAGPREIGTVLPERDTETSHPGAEQAAIVEHEGAGWFPTLDGWGLQ